VIDWLAQQDASIYLVGGCVRDGLLNRPVHDLDVATDGDGLALARHLANRFGGAYYPLDEARGTGRAILLARSGQRLVVDVARFRGPELTSDLADRDFSVNAMAANVRTPADVIDHHNGLNDLEAGLIRTVSVASIRSDPLRALRAVRLAGELKFELSPETETLIRRDGLLLSRVAGERVRDELARMLALSDAAPLLVCLDGLGLLGVITPELEPLRDLAQPPPHHLDVLVHSLETVRALEEILHDIGWVRDGEREPESLLCNVPNPELRALAPFAERLCSHLDKQMSESRSRLVTVKLAALLHDTGKPAARSVDQEGRIRFFGHHERGARIAARVLRRLRLNNSEVRLAETMVRHHMRPLLLASQKGVSSRAVYRFFRDTGDAGVDVLVHSMADQQATYGASAEDRVWSDLVALVARMLGDYWERRAERVEPRPLIDGHDLLRDFGLQPGPHIGELLEKVREAQVCGEVETRAEALALVHSHLEKEG
jgi:tRNA nucleotidyltransferase/poly(A) polymerase